MVFSFDYTTQPLSYAHNACRESGHVGNLANMGGLQEMSNFTDESGAMSRYTSLCEEDGVAAIHIE